MLNTSQDPSAPQHVLTPTWTGNERKRYEHERRKAKAAGTVVKLDQGTWQELRDAGTFGDAGDREEMYSKQEWEMATYGLADDGYDYTQHMKTLGGGAYTGAKYDPIVAQVIREVEQEVRVPTLTTETAHQKTKYKNAGMFACK